MKPIGDMAKSCLCLSTILRPDIVRLATCSDNKFTEWWTLLGLVKVCGVRRTYQTRNLLLFTPHFITFFCFFKTLLFKYFKNVNSNHLSCVCRWTGLPIHATQNNITSTMNIVLCFVTVLYHNVNMSYKVNIVFNKITTRSMFFLTKNKNETKQYLSTK